MVANQSIGPLRDHKGLSAALTKVRMDKDKKYILNLPEWKERISEPVPVPVCQSQSQCKCQSQCQSQCARARANASVPEPEPVCQSQCASAREPDKNNNNNKDKEKGKGSEEASRETALRAGTRTGKCSKSTSSGKKILGMCHYFQTAKGCSQ